MNFTINNSRSAWGMLKRTVDTEATNGAIRNLNVTVKISDEISKDESNVSNLIYFFPIAEVAINSGVQKCVLNIKMMNLSKMDTLFANSQYRRISHLLYLQTNLRDKIMVVFESQFLEMAFKRKVFDDYVPILQGSRQGRLSPIFATTNTQNSMFYYRKMLDVFNFDDELVNCDDLNYRTILKFLKYIAIKQLNEPTVKEAKEYLNFTNYPHIEQYINYSFITAFNKLFKDEFELEKEEMYVLISQLPTKNNKELENITREEFEQHKLSLANLFMPNSKSRNQNIYFTYFLSQLSYIVTNIHGSQQTKMKSSQKKAIIEKLFEYIEINLKNVSAISLYIWVLLVRDSISNKELWVNEKDGYVFADGILTNITNNALSLGDGIYQIAENACFHSEGKTGYFAIRIHHTDTSHDNTNLLKNASTYALLCDKYNQIDESHKPFEKLNTSKKYLELTFIDSSYNTTNRNIKGIIENYNSREPEKVQQIAKLSDLFNEKTVNEKEDIYVHYGLRIFERVSIINNGLLQLTSLENYNGHICKFSYYSYYSENYICKDIVTPNLSVFSEDKEFTDDSTTFSGTEYNFIMPLQKQDIYQKTTIPFNQDQLFEIKNIRNDFKCLEIDLSSATSLKMYASSQDDKTKKVEALVDFLSNELESIELDKQIICLKATDFTYNDVEILAKALMKYFIENNNQKNRFALMFYNKSFIREFIRIYTVFFDKMGMGFSKEGNSKNVPNTTDTQLALCSVRDDLPEVNFIFGGNNLETALRTARQYAYYNSEMTKEFIPLLTYITDYRKAFNSNKVIELSPTFPFDLYLNIDFDKESVVSESASVENKTWFFRRINKALQTDMKEESYGCKLDNVHISIGSKIHIDTFYNAELLFHNYANTSRFAYLIAKNIIREHTANTYLSSDICKEIVLVSYSEYSLLLIQQIYEILNCIFESTIKVNYIMFSSDANALDSDLNGNLWPDFQKFLKGYGKEDFNKIKYYVVLPIATTLTTVCKIQNIIKRIVNIHLNGKNSVLDVPVNFGASNALIVVTPTSDSTNNYWLKNDTNSKYIILNSRSGKKVSEADMVRYYFNPTAKWYDPSDRCELCDAITKNNIEDVENNKFSTLIGVDKSSTLPNAIFDIQSQKGNCLNKPRFNYEKKDKNDNKIDGFYHCVNNSHIRNENNHFQFIFDFQKYCKKCGNDINIWLKKEVRPNIEPDAFNIILSPLNTSNSIFLKSVLEHGFESCQRLINVHINNTYKDEIRTKYNYIAKECKKMKQAMGKVKINVYFVDDCIISGATIIRAKQYVNMLLNDKNFDKDEINIYKGIILLANRSSYDTIYNFLEERTNDSFFYYVGLNLPSYNMRNGNCPACDLVEQYDIMHKRSSTSIIADEYSRLKDKHTTKPKSEYSKWLDNVIQEKPSYIKWFLRWLYHSHVTIKDRKLFYTNICGKRAETDVPEGFEVFLYKLNIKTMEGENKTFLDDSVSKEYVDTIYRLIKETILGDKDYLRMVCTHKIFTELYIIHDEMSKKEKVCFADYEKKTTEAILDLITNKFEEIDKQNHNANKITVWLKSEWLISYIKVISRSQPASYYYVRNAIYKILYDIIMTLLYDDGISIESSQNKESLSKEDKKNSFSIKGDADYVSKISKIIDLCKIKDNDTAESSVMPEVKLIIFLTCIRRISAMNSSLVLYNIEKIYTYYIKCKKQFENSYGNINFFAQAEKNERDRLVSFFTEDEFNISIAKLIKWSAMSDYDESSCFKIEHECSFKKEVKILTDNDKESSDHHNEDSELSVEKKENILCKNVGYIKKLAFLENVQVIYSGIRKLVENYSEDEIINNMRTICESVYDLYEDGGETNKVYRELNQNKNLFKFIDSSKIYAANEDKLKYHMISTMCQYFRTLKNLSKQNAVVESPYDYNSICNNMCDILGFEQCTIFIDSDGIINEIVGSDISKNYLCDEVNKYDIECVINKFEEVCKQEKGNLSKRTVQKLAFKENEFIVINLPITNNQHHKVYIVIYKHFCNNEVEIQTKIPLKNEALPIALTFEEYWKVRNIIFMRDNLEYVLSRDIVALQNMSTSAGYIKCLNDNPVVCHLSDLHVSPSTPTSLAPNADIITNADLLLITGDVVQGAYSATELIDNYNKAIIIIKQIVEAMWAVENTGRVINGVFIDKRIRADWKKRIVISVGNHDYASMNELQATNKRRATTAGEPGDLGTSMIKYSYFIHFLHNLLGKDIDYIIEYNMNEFINFDKLNLTVININTCDGVNPYRTNKVRIDNESVFNLVENKTPLDNVIYMMHHTPMYNIDYVADIYYITNSNAINAIKEKIDSLSYCSNDDISMTWINMLKTLPEHSYATCDIREVSKKPENEEYFNNQLRVFAKVLKTNSENQFKSDNLSDFEYFALLTPEDRYCDDRCNNICAEIKTNMEVSKIDNEVFATTLKKVFDEQKNKFYILGGHLHTTREYIGSHIGALHKCMGIYEMEKSIQPNPNKRILDYTVSYGILKIGNSDGSCDSSYTFKAKSTPIQISTEDIHITLTR